MNINNTNNTNNISYKKELYCMNCNKDGHTFKKCREPIISCGIILLSLEIDQTIKDMLTNELSYLNNNNNNLYTLNENNDNGIIINDQIDIELFCKFKNQIKFLLIRRKHTLGFLEFVRGRYNIDNVDGIIFLFKQMTSEEINKINIFSFDEIWDDVWGDNKRKLLYQNEYITSKEKFDKLKKGNTEYLGLKFYIENVTPLWNCAEWGFPKGRRNFKESNIECAVREFKEETKFTDNEFILLSNITEINENFIGTNGINYKHIYCPAISLTDKIPYVDTDDYVQSTEIGDIGYFSYEEAIKKFRPYHIDRQKILTCMYIYIINCIIRKVSVLNNTI